MPRRQAQRNSWRTEEESGEDRWRAVNVNFPRRAEVRDVGKSSNKLKTRRSPVFFSSLIHITHCHTQQSPSPQSTSAPDHGDERRRLLRQRPRRRHAHRLLRRLEHRARRPRGVVELELARDQLDRRPQRRRRRRRCGRRSSWSRASSSSTTPRGRRARCSRRRRRRWAWRRRGRCRSRRRRSSP